MSKIKNYLVTVEVSKNVVEEFVVISTGRFTTRAWCKYTGDEKIRHIKRITAKKLAQISRRNPDLYVEEVPDDFIPRLMTRKCYLDEMAAYDC